MFVSMLAAVCPTVPWVAGLRRPDVRSHTYRLSPTHREDQARGPGRPTGNLKPPASDSMPDRDCAEGTVGQGTNEEGRHAGGRTSW